MAAPALAVTPQAQSQPQPQAVEARCVARQPIFDRTKKLVGYELLYRSSGTATTSAGGLSSVQMSGSTVVNGVLDIGLDYLTGAAPAWINCEREFLISGALEVLDPKRVVLEVLETVTPDEEVIEAVRKLRDRGFTIALDDFEGGEEWDPLLRMARTVKLDVLNVPVDELALRVKRLKKYPVRLLAERVEDNTVHEYCLGLGFDFFQGYHFKKPEVVQRKTLPVAMSRVVKLMQMVNDPRTGDFQIEQELRTDPGLSVKLLRIVNNASTGVREVGSIGHAIRLAGRRTIYQWLAMLLVSSVPTPDDVAKEAVLVSLERGRFCELLALGTGKKDQADPLFMAGLLADLDVLLGMDRDELIVQLGVADDVAAALRGDPGPHTDYLQVANAYATGEWDQVTQKAAPLGVAEQVLPEWYGAAGGWAREVLKAR